MLECFVSIRKPTDKSIASYRYFYNFYSLQQINTLIIEKLLDSTLPEKKMEILQNIDTTGFDFQQIEVFTLAMGLYNPSTQKRGKENRTLDFSLVEELNRKGIDSYNWYLHTNEYTSLYTAFEQSIKDFLVSINIDPSKLKERTILSNFFTAINDKRTLLLKEISDSSASIIESQNEIIVLWQYFTEIRNLYIHSGGRVTDRFIDNMSDLKTKIGTDLHKIFNKESMIIENACRYDSYDELFAFNFDKDDIFVLDDLLLNFFRNFVVIINEAIDTIYSK